MSRRSSRLVSGGYYNSDEDSDSSNMTSISYRENPVKVFKKRGTPKTRVPVKDISVSSAVFDPPLTADQNVDPSSCSYEGRPGLRKGFQKDVNLGGIDTSGYSSSEGSTRNPVGTPSISHGTTPGFSVRCRDLLFRLMDSVPLTAEALRQRIMRLTASAAQMSASTKKTFCLVLFVVALSLWFLLPSLTSYFSHMAAVKTSSQTQHQNHPNPSASRPHPPTVVMQLDIQDVKTKLEDIQDVKTKLDALDSYSHQGLEKQMALLEKQMADDQTQSDSAYVRLNLRIQAVEDKHAELSQELLSLRQSRPVPVPGPLTPQLQQALEGWLSDRIKEQDVIRLSDKQRNSDCGRPAADNMADFALESQGASVVSTRCSETYHIGSACVTVFGFPLWYPSESPRTAIQGHSVPLPGRCWAFHGVQGTLVISLSHAIRISHVTLDHLPRYNSPTGRIDSAPRDFEIYGMNNDKEDGSLLGKFTYDKDGAPTQTFELVKPSEVVHRYVELRVLTNWGQVEYTCVYRFRVHGTMASP